TITEAIELTNDKLTGYRDYVISEIKVSIGCDAFGAEPGVPYEVWIQNSLPSDPTNANVVATGVSTSSVWNLISVIKTPIPDSGSVFIGINFDQDAGQYPCGIDESTSSPSNAGLLWTSSGWTNLGGAGFPGVWGLSVGVSVSANNPPNTPSKPSGPVTGEDEEEYTYSTSTTDPDGDKVKYGWEWTGDNIVDSWTDLYTSGTTSGVKIVFDEIGTYYLRVKAEDEHGAQSSFSQPLTVIIESGNKPPNIPTITGPSQGKVETFYDYTISAMDREGDDVLYWVEWGDGTNTGWIGPYPSGETIMLSYYWGETGDYLIKVIAKDIYGEESDFSAPIWMNVTASPELDIIIRPSGFGVAATIVNRGKETAVNATWNITLDGGIIIYGESKESNITEILPGETVNIFSLVFGLFKININATVGNSSDSLGGFLIGPLFSSNNDEKTYEGKIIKIDSNNKEITVQLEGLNVKKTFKYDNNTKFLDKNGDLYINMQKGDSVKVTWKHHKNGDAAERLAIEIRQQ
ncbi:MAG: hypothetical protein MUO82_11360, partial [Candidatus Thermoplasmatota archaeon]|nr:hypothetical protein [Candidatus Thermoplasmatota archaeon]